MTQSGNKALKRDTRGPGFEAEKNSGKCSDSGKCSEPAISQASSAHTLVQATIPSAQDTATASPLVFCPFPLPSILNEQPECSCQNFTSFPLLL